VITGFFSLPSFINEGIEGLRIYKQYYILPVSLYLFSNFEKTTGIPYNRMLLFCIKTAALYVIINTFLYFVEFPVWTRYRPWWGRISQGYPTCDILSLAFVLTLTLLNKHIMISLIKRVMYSIVIIIGIAIIASGTGIVLVTIIMIAALFICMFESHSYILKKTFIVFISLTVIIITFGAIALKTFDPDLYNGLYYVMESRIATLIGKEHELNTMTVRSDQIETMNKQHVNKIEHKIFGVGFGLVNYESKEIHNSKYIYVENQYALNKLTGGIISNTLFILFLCIYIFNELNRKHYELSDRILKILCPVFLAVSSFTVIPLGAYSIMLSFSIINSSPADTKNLYRT
jgi:hypothetical protein